MKPQIPWLRVLIEGVVIVGSILLAFGIDAWWEGRQERELETEYLARLAGDLERDTAEVRSARRAFALKADALARLSTLDPDSRSISVSQLAEDLATGTSWSWNFNEGNSTTFEEMRTSGRLGLIQEPEVRAAISDYYDEHENILATIDARRTDFGQLSYRLVRRPRPSEGDLSTSTDFEAADLGPMDVELLLQRETLVEVRRTATAEQSFSFHAAQRAGQMDRAAGRLLDRLREYAERR